EDSEGGEAGVLAVDVRLDVVGGNDFKNDEASEDEERVCPSRKDGEREHGRGEGGDGRADVGDEAADGGECGEKHCVRQADEVERDADDGAEGEVHGDLKQEISGDAASGVAHSLGHKGKIAIAGESDEAVAKVFSLEEDEERKDDGEQGGGSRLDDTAKLIEAPGRTVDFAYLNGMVGSRAEGAVVATIGRVNFGSGVGDAEFVADIFELSLSAAEGGVARAVQRLHFLRDVVAVRREV